MLKDKSIKNVNERKIILAVADMFLIGVAALLSNYFLRLFNLGDLTTTILSLETCMLIIVTFLTLWICGAYSKMWRYFKAKDYLSCVLGTVSGLIIVVAFTWVAFPAQMNFSNLYIFWAFFLALGTLFIVSFRLLFKKTFLVLVETGRDEMKKRTLLVGGGLAGRIILTELEDNEESKDDNGVSSMYEVVGVIDDDSKKIGTKIKNVQVLGSTADIARIAQEEDIKVIIFAIPSCDEEDRRRILDSCSKTKCEIKIVPYLSQLLFDDNDKKPKIIHQMKDIKIEDLLGRPAITFDKKEIQQLIVGKVCMVTGGGGSIGSELVRQIAQYKPKQVVIVDIYENNAYDVQQELVMQYGEELNLVTLIASVRDYDKMQVIFEKYRPDLVFHAAAHKHVPLMEDSPEEAVKNNVIGTFNVSTLAAFYNVQKFIMISTDKAVNPTNVMGATKRCCEMVIQYMAQSGTDTEFVTTRFGNVLGSNGSVIPLFKRQIESGKAVTVTHPDIIRYFMTIPEAVSLVLEAGSMAHGGEIFVLDMGAPVKITTLAENLIRMYGKVPYKDIEIKFTGLRPGEKLFEELLMDEEGLKSTSNKKIFIGNHIPIEMQTFLEQLDKLKTLANSNNPVATVNQLARIVPTFNHQINNNPLYLDSEKNIKN
ncbi:MAG TPA: polysaccharide biosynthesis protein [Clostridiales bacterium]|nr:polysaccharide biosynthesis protein [Clostridiales bacterium]